MNMKKLKFTFIRLLFNNSVRKKHSFSWCWTSRSFNWTLLLQKILDLDILIPLRIIIQLSRTLTRKRANRYLVLMKSHLFRGPWRINCSLRFLRITLFVQLINTLSLFSSDLFLLFFKPLNIWTWPIRPNYFMCK